MLLKIALIGIPVLIVLLLIFDVGFITSRFIKPLFTGQTQSQSSKAATVSGTIQVNGQIPQGSSISVGVRPYGTTSDFAIFVSGLPAADDTPWQYTQAKEGQSYEFQAYLDLNGSRAAVSSPWDVSAPATDEVLTLNIESQSTTPASISGNVFINGYIPPGSTFNIVGRKYGTGAAFTVVVQNLPATVKRTMTYANAITGQKYEIKGQLFDAGGNPIGTSDPLMIAAPSDNAQLTINSTATPPQGAVTVIQNNTAQGSTSPSTTGASTISGTINFNGSAPSGTSIVILAQPAGAQNQYQVVVNGIQPVNGAVWSWSGAIAGASYNMVAVLKGNSSGQNTDYADSQTYTVAAPASNQLFTLNTGIPMGAPTGSVYTTCNTHNPNNTWAATVNFTSVSGAQSYILQVGSTSGGSDIVNTSVQAQNAGVQTVNATLTDSVIYYAQYAVSSVSNPTPAQYSPFSGAYTIKCPS